MKKGRIRQVSDKTRRRNAELAKVCAEVLEERPQCELQLRGCTGQAVTCHHRSARSTRPDLVTVKANLASSCSSCNMLLETLVGEELDDVKRRGLKLSAWEEL